MRIINSYLRIIMVWLVIDSCKCIVTARTNNYQGTSEDYSTNSNGNGNQDDHEDKTTKSSPLLFPTESTSTSAVTYPELNSQGCSDRSLKFELTNVLHDAVTFQWQHPKCSINNKQQLYYDIVITGPNKENNTFELNAETKFNLRSYDQRWKESKNLAFIPCESYGAKLFLKSSFFETLKEEFLAFTIPQDNTKEIIAEDSLVSGPGWVSLTWNSSKACYRPNSNNWRVQSVIFTITGGRQRQPNNWVLSVEKDGKWDRSETEVTLNFTNAGKNCAINWCWEPCTNYKLKITPVLVDQQGVQHFRNSQRIHEIRTPLENREIDAKVRDLELVDRGLQWLSLRWKAPYCLPEKGRLYAVILQTSPQITWATCPEELLSNATLKTEMHNGEAFHTYNLTKCDKPLTPCTEYKIRIRGEYVDNATKDAKYRRSNDFTARTLPPSIQRLELKEGFSANMLQLSWFTAINCNNKPLSSYQLSLKADSIPVPGFPMEINPYCGRYNICEKELQATPCTRYEAEIVPFYADIPEKISPSVALYYTSFPNAGENYAISSVAVGSQWVTLNFTLQSQCLHKLQGLSLGFTDEIPPKTQVQYFVNKECLIKNAIEDTVVLNVTRSECFDNFIGLNSCSGRYRVRARPVLLPQIPPTKEPQPVETTFALPRGDITSIPSASIAKRGVSWFHLTWQPPTCSEYLTLNTPYNITIYENNARDKGCSFTSFVTERNVSFPYVPSLCRGMQMKPCTEYFFEVRAWFDNKDLNAMANSTQSNIIRTLPAPTQSRVQNLSVLTVESSRVLLSWQPPQCSHFLIGYTFWLHENDDDKRLVSFTNIPPTCLNSDYQIYWPLVTDCSIEAGSGHSEDNLQPCSNYTLLVQPRQQDEYGTVINSDSEKVTFSTSYAKPGKVSFLNLTASTNETLSVNWGDVTSNSRCLRGYEVSLTNTDGRIIEESFLYFANTYTFQNLSPCSKYHVAIRSIGKTEGDFLEEIQTYATQDLRPGQPQNVTHHSRLPHSLNLTWSKPEINSQCVRVYRIVIFKVESNDTKLFEKNITSTETHVYIPDLLAGTKYAFHVMACTRNSDFESIPSPLEIITESITISQLSVASMVIPIIVCIFILIFLIYCCYFKQHWRTFKGYFSDKESSPFRSRPSYSRADPIQLDEEVTGPSRSIRRASRQSMRNLAVNRPIPIQQFDAVLNELTENTCALLSEQFADLKVLANENQPKTCGAKGENKLKNRYINILPYDKSRVRLTHVAEDEHGDYINASYIQGFNGAREYIAAQGPKPVTVPDFWRMIWEQDVRIVVMVTQVEEQDKIKCAQYWPESKQVISYGDIKVTQILQVDMDDYVIRDLEAEHDGAKRVIKHMHFLVWPDFGCPNDLEAMLSFIEAVRDRVSSLSTGGPILVHCSAGVGRTGTFIAIDWLTQEARISSQLDIFNTVIKLRSDRMNMVQTKDQFHFIHECISHFLKTRIREPSPVYANTRNLNCNQDVNSAFEP